MPIPVPPDLDRPILLFDGECAFCTRVAEWLLERLRRPVAVVPWQNAHLAQHGLDEATVRRYVAWIDEAGRLALGHRAAGRALLACSGGWRLLGRCLLWRPAGWLARPGYRLVARFRGRLPGVMPACRRDRWPPTARPPR